MTSIQIKGSMSPFANIEKFSLSFPILSFVIRVNLLHPERSLFLYGLLLSLWCSSILIDYYSLVSFNFKAILYIIKITQSNTTYLFLQNQVHLHRMFEQWTKLGIVLVSRGERFQKAIDMVISWATLLPIIQPRLEILWKLSLLELQHVLQPWQILPRTQITASL